MTSLKRLDFDRRDFESVEDILGDVDGDIVIADNTPLDTDDRLAAIVVGAEDEYIGSDTYIELTGADDCAVIDDEL